MHSDPHNWVFHTPPFRELPKSETTTQLHSQNSLRVCQSVNIDFERGNRRSQCPLCDWSSFRPFIITSITHPFGRRKSLPERPGRILHLSVWSFNCFPSYVYFNLRPVPPLLDVLWKCWRNSKCSVQKSTSAASQRNHAFASFHMPLESYEMEERHIIVALADFCRCFIVGILTRRFISQSFGITAALLHIRFGVDL